MTKVSFIGIRFKAGKRGTCWWSNARGRWREDTITAISRHYNRRERVYVYRLTVGRFTVGVGFAPTQFMPKALELALIGGCLTTIAVAVCATIWTLKALWSFAGVSLWW